jgi:hypothetical protein
LAAAVLVLNRGLDFRKQRSDSWIADKTLKKSTR